jgi:hypothetical protein
MIVLSIVNAPHASFQDFIATPTQTTINTLGVPVAELNHPAITVCKENGIYDVGDYLRAVFDNFKFTCTNNKSSKSCQENRNSCIISTMFYGKTATCRSAVSYSRCRHNLSKFWISLYKANGSMLNIEHVNMSKKKPTRIWHD